MASLSLSTTLGSNPGIGFFSGVDLRSSDNNRAHRTDEIDTQRLIVRRGKPFSVVVQCSSEVPYGYKSDDEIVIRQHTAGGQWYLLQQRAQDEVLLTVHSPARAAIGQYHLAVVLMSGNRNILEESASNKIYVLFNPWCKDDLVYLPDESLLQEYVMNEYGVIYTGSSDSIHGLPWNFGQFEDSVLDICFEILDHSIPALSDPVKDRSQRWDPVYVSRTIIAMVNSNDDRGVLVGKWQGSYSDGVAPTKWMSSVPILEKWSKSKSGVKYGQCWVYATVACTVLRCLGLPTRCITNFNSAHDSDGTLSIDRVYDIWNHMVDDPDSIWNFHCWIESYMQREDLPEGYGGWQALDPTPQEKSSGVFQCGPCPLKAIKEGDLKMKYDAPFIFAEVNADIISWLVEVGGHRKQISSQTSHVGRNISTKSPYGDMRQDVTLEYKYREGSTEEREVYKKAGRRSTDPPAFLREVQLEVKHDHPVLGMDFDIVFELKNTKEKEAHCKLTMVTKGVTYNSITLRECLRGTVDVVIPPHKTHREVLHLSYAKYGSCVNEQHIIRALGMVDVSGEDKSILEMINVTLRKPEITVKFPGRLTVGQKSTAVISFTNPLPVPLKNGLFTVEGAGLVPTTEIRVSGTIMPQQNVTVQFTFMALRSGVRQFLVDFDSDILQDVKGVVMVVVNAAPYGKDFITPAFG
ncbi:unnamed protein product [Merluccius merluccius]